VAVPIASSAAPGVKLGKPQVLFTVESRLLNGYDVFPDGQRFLIPEPLEATKPPWDSSRPKLVCGIRTEALELAMSIQEARLPHRRRHTSFALLQRRLLVLIHHLPARLRRQ